LQKVLKPSRIISTKDAFNAGIVFERTTLLMPVVCQYIDRKNWIQSQAGIWGLGGILWYSGFGLNSELGPIGANLQIWPKCELVKIYK